MLRALIPAMLVLPFFAALGAQAATRRSQPAPKTGSISGVVHDRSGVAIPGVAVAIPQFGRADTTDARGAFRFASVAPGLWVVDARRPNSDASSALTSVRVRAGSVAAAALVLAPRAVGACADDAARVTDGPLALRIRATPEHPRQGTLAELEIALADSAAPDSIVRVEGRFAGEPLYFEPRSPRRWRAIIAVPVDSGGALRFEGRAWTAGGRSAAVDSRITIDDGAFVLEKLTVAPEFGRPPSRALAARMEAEAALAREIARASRDHPRLWHDAFVLPRDTRVTSEFGGGRQFNGKVQSRHMGVDFAGAVGAPIHAANRGVVALVADFYLAGTAVYLDHGRGLITGYFHMSRPLVAMGDTVERGAEIGRVGATGRVTGPHLHWIARLGGTSIDARSALALPARPAADPASCERP